MRKRLFSFAVALLTVVLMLPAGVFAEGTDVEVDLGDLYNMQFLVETVTVGNDDETAVVNISIEKNGGFAAMNYMLLFDKDVLSLEEQPTPSSVIKDGYIGNAKAQLCDAKIMKEVMSLVYSRSGGIEILSDDKTLNTEWYE
jgi:hypothetical protein